MNSHNYLRSLTERILRLKQDQDAIGEDVREVYAEAKSAGFDKTTLGKLVTYLRKREKDGAKLQEEDALFDLYLSAYDGAPSRAYARAREGGAEDGETFDPETGELQGEHCDENLASPVAEPKGGSSSKAGRERPAGAALENGSAATAAPSISTDPGDASDGEVLSDGGGPARDPDAGSPRADRRDEQGEDGEGSDGQGGAGDGGAALCGGLEEGTAPGGLHAGEHPGQVDAGSAGAVRGLAGGQDGGGAASHAAGGAVAGRRIEDAGPIPKFLKREAGRAA